MAHEAGKGSRPRPYSVSREKFNENWEAIFGGAERDQRSEVPTEQSPPATEAQPMHD